MLLAAGARASKRWTWGRVATDTIEALADAGPDVGRNEHVNHVRVWRSPGRSPGRRSAIGAYDESILAALAANVDDRGDRCVRRRIRHRRTDARRPRRAASSQERWPVAIDRPIPQAVGLRPRRRRARELAAPRRDGRSGAARRRVTSGCTRRRSSGFTSALPMRPARSRGRSHMCARSLAVDRVARRCRTARTTTTCSMHHASTPSVSRSLADTLRHARSVIVSSERAADVGALDPQRRPAAPRAPAGVSRHGGRRNATLLRASTSWRSVGSRRTRPRPTRSKCWHGSYRPATPGSTFVGPTVDSRCRRGRVGSARLGVTDRVTITGRLDDDDYRATARQRRESVCSSESGDRGEMSAAVTDLVAAGTPTVTTLEHGRTVFSRACTVVDHDIDAIVTALVPLLTDDAAWHTASSDALSSGAALDVRRRRARSCCTGSTTSTNSTRRRSAGSGRC